MSRKGEIIFLSTIHRMSERVIGAINELQEDYDVKIINCGQSSFNTKYESNMNYRKYVIDNFKEDSVFNSSGVAVPQRFSHSTQSKEVLSFVGDLISEDTVSLILDDSRNTINSSKLYNIAKDKNLTVFANAHGNASGVSDPPQSSTPTQ